MKRLFALTITFLSLVPISKANTHFVSDPQRSGEAGILMANRANDTAGYAPVRSISPATYHGNIYKIRLDSIQKDVQLDYNGYVQEYIDNYLLSGRADIGREIGLSKYYFPIYEKAFSEAGIPDEIKYLSIVESQLNPNAVSRVGATGPWQFMSNTARLYGLSMDNYIDERRDPIKSSYAAAAYLKDAYQQFGDWLLAIASYNCGQSNVVEAIEKAGSSDYWSIRQYLPAETRGYVPAYIAITYIMNYYQKYNIIPQQCYFAVKTDTVLVHKVVSLSSISRVIGISMGQLCVLNPAYTQLLIRGSADSPKRLIIPELYKEKYKTLYKSLNSDLGAASIPESDRADRFQQVEKRTPVRRRVRKFEGLASTGKTRSGLKAKLDKG